MAFIRLHRHSEAGGVVFFFPLPLTRRFDMKFRDLFVPRWYHSNPEVRKKAIARIENTGLLMQIAEKDDDPMVRDTASARLVQIADQERQIAE
jgi:hypothetical protein